MKGFKQFSDPIKPKNSKINPRKLPKGPNIDQYDECKIEKWLELENEISYPQEEKLHNSFLDIDISQDSSIPPNKKQYYPTSYQK